MYYCSVPGLLILLEYDYVLSLSEHPIWLRFLLLRSPKRVEVQVYDQLWCRSNNCIHQKIYLLLIFWDSLFVHITIKRPLKRKIKSDEPAANWLREFQSFVSPVLGTPLCDGPLPAVKTYKFVHLCVLFLLFLNEGIFDTRLLNYGSVLSLDLISSKVFIYHVLSISHIIEIIKFKLCYIRQVFHGPNWEIRWPSECTL